LKVLTVIGARPQFIKAAPVSRALAKASIEEVLVHTGQHFDAAMSDIFFSEMEIAAPKHHFGIGGLSHGAMTGRMLEAMDGVLALERPDAVLVYGDTNSTLAGALAAVKLHVPVAHVEAGLRSFNMQMPEEINRRLTDHVSSLLLVPNDTAVENLRREGITEGVHRVGDVMYDASLLFLEPARRHARVLETLGLRPGEFVLATVHRAENTDVVERLENIFAAFAELAKEVRVVVPLHPRTRKILASCGWKAPPGLDVVDPVGFLDMLMLERSARLIATDSGGVQKEAYFYGVPCVTLRDETEWVELVRVGANRLAPPTERAALLAALREGVRRGPLDDGRPQLYGDGHASERIAKILAEHGGGR
jgi:UDP-GlcNAc3NAcA epimerase